MPYQSPKEGYNFFKPLSQTSKDGNKIVPTSGTLPSTNIVDHFEHIIYIYANNILLNMTENCKTNKNGNAHKIMQHT